MRWQDAHREAMAVAASALEELRIDAFERVDVFDAMAADGVKLMFRRLEGCAALYLTAEDGGRAGATVNANHPLALQRYSAAHEYGHHVFGHDSQIDRDTEPRGTGAALPPHEKLAEAFAAWFLMPPEAAEPALARLGRDHAETPADAYALALRLGTSFRATCIHLPSLKLGSRKAVDWANKPLKPLKQELTSTPPPGGWQNDVWLIRETDANSTLVIRAGDRLLFDLPGYAIDAVPDGASTVEVPPPDLLSTARLCMDFPPGTDAGAASVRACGDGATLEFRLVVERPRLGRFVRVVAT